MVRKRNRLPEAAPVSYQTCVVCRLPGIVAAEVFPFWWGLPIGHKWCHRSCAERYRAALAAAQRRRAVEGCKPKAPAGDVRERESLVAGRGDMAGTVTEGSCNVEH